MIVYPGDLFTGKVPFMRLEWIENLGISVEIQAFL